MNELTREVLIFSTNVNTVKAVRKLAPLFNGHQLISKWSFDLEDCDKILRIEAAARIPDEIINILRSKGFNGKELS
ncbi:hypothetical protein HF324_12650 [Chitinophaga oryzae]|uniref:Uncharacterized protein n=1 Tax=Chitinophaga oryzae TaxID=2725414 RepID=A0ABX6LEX2_9BACT|nr:hypothetical protein [Chitinophaga oryzae]QJB38669.1 hypothetical protein HF324_12650 [Chitinophaga oryzae]